MIKTGSFKVGDCLIATESISKSSISHRDFDTVLHEVGHRLQSVMPKLDEYYRQLWIDRTDGEMTRPLRDIQREKGVRSTYKVNEQGRKDSFTNVYIGKDYGTDDEPKPLEVLTMAFETVLGTNNKETLSVKMLLQNDPELLYLTIALLTRFNP